MNTTKLYLQIGISKILCILTTVLFLLTSFSLNTAAQNGIYISEPKAYDDRTLTIMLEQLNAQLRNIQFIDQAKLAAQLGLLQGYQSKDVSRSLDISTLPIPGLKTTRTPDTSGNLSISEQIETQDAITPKAPGLPPLLTNPTYTPTFGENPSDLLDDQVNLTYQIFNLRMILERSLSDRMWIVDGVAKPRMIAVIGFDIDIHPPADVRDHAAYVEVTIKPKNDGSPAASLIALMPQEKTYNSVAVNSKSTAFGGSAIAKIITIGYSEQRRGQTLYLFRDTDTSTITYPSNDTDKSTKFGWVFRPVLGRRSVSENKRHMFAVIALPESDIFNATNTSEDNEPEKPISEISRERKIKGFPVIIQARTYWRKYNRDKLTISGEEKMVQPYAVNKEQVILTTSEIQKNLEPKIRSVTWSATDDRTAVVTVQGDNLFTGTSIFLGNNVYDSEANGLVIKSSQSLQVKTTLSALTTGDAVLNGRYGTTKPLLIKDDISSNVPNGVKINKFSFSSEPGRKLINLSLFLEKRDIDRLANLRMSELPRQESLIIAVQNTPLPQPYFMQDIECNTYLPEPKPQTKQCVLLQVNVPADLLKSDTIVSFKYPFRGNEWTGSMVYYEPYQINDITRIGTENGKTILAIAGRGFDSGWKVQLDKDYSTTEPQSVPLLFAKADLSNSTSLVTKLQNKTDPLAEYIRKKISTTTVDLIDKYTDTSKPPEEALLAALLKDLNIWIGMGSSIYRKTPFAQVQLTEEIKKLNSQMQKGDDLIRLNRLLLWNAYPLELPRPPEPDKNAKAVLEFVNGSLLIFRVDNTTLSNYKNMIILAYKGKLPTTGEPVYEPILKAVPSATPKAPEPKLNDGQNLTVMQNTAPGVEFKGSDLGAITKVTFNGKVLPHKTGKDGNSIIVFLSRTVTSKSGPTAVLLWAGDTIVQGNLTVQEKATAK